MTDPFAQYDFFAQPLPPPRRKKRIWLWAMLSALVLLLVAGGTWLVIETSGSGPDKPATSAADADTAVETVTASDGRSTLTIPKQWGELPKRFQLPGSVIARGQIFQERYLLMISDDPEGFTDFADYVDTVEKSLERMTLDQPEDDTINGLHAVRFEATGAVEGHDVVYWCTAIEGKRGYHQILMWTLADRRAEAEPVMRRIVDSFRET